MTTSREKNKTFGEVCGMRLSVCGGHKASHGPTIWDLTSALWETTQNMVVATSTESM